ncbi:pluviatolide O-methyltransferase-like [Cryptomeria japonica]|uniref:pluviatolide O-methyltransferase-like n=1 Tax=Cryptomeria japonica TaxID=3369 RepID=UPI0027DA85D8|nr:pluviatolide O-methyltransferase-like [Cryptomeria japonica]
MRNEIQNALVGLQRNPKSEDEYEEVGEELEAEEAEGPEDEREESFLRTMAQILHDWSDAHCIKLLKNCHKALPENGKVIVVDSILPVAAETSSYARQAFHVDLCMLVHNPGGKERTEEEFKQLAKAAGFAGGAKPICCVNVVWWILHDWSDDHCIKLLKNCHKALPENGKVIVVDSILPVAAETSSYARQAFHVDLCMLVHNPGGKERTEEEFKQLAKAAGFAGGAKPICCVNGVWVIEIQKWPHYMQTTQ